MIRKITIVLATALLFSQANASSIGVNSVGVKLGSQEFGFDIVATSGTTKVLLENGVKCKEIYKVGEGRPNVVDAIKNNEIQLIINTPLGKQSRYDEYEIGKAAIKYKVTAITTIEVSQAAVRAAWIRCLLRPSAASPSRRNRQPPRKREFRSTRWLAVRRRVCPPPHTIFRRRRIG